MKTQRFVGLLLFSLIVAGAGSPQMRAVMSLPGDLDMTTASHIALPPALRFWNLQAHGSVSVEGGQLKAMRSGLGEVDVRLFEGGPRMRQVVVRSRQAQRVVPSGAAIGIVLKTQHPIVVGQSRVVTHGGGIAFPARAAGVMVGDRILSINGRSTHGSEQVARVVDGLGRGGKTVSMRVARGRESLTLVVRPALDGQKHRYRLGLYLKDRISGVGTLTFVDPRTHTFAALGHQVSDPLRRPMTASGDIVSASIIGFEKGRRGHPGEKIGVLDEGESLGIVQGNSTVGLVGKFRGDVAGPLVPVANIAEVHPGPATIWTVAAGDHVEAFSARIERVYPQRAPSSKGLVIRITDARLLKQSGGIVQGMSGSPILQDGKLAGAVTHVFVGDPSRGYGVFAKWMLNAVDGQAPQQGTRVKSA